MAASNGFGWGSSIAGILLGISLGFGGSYAKALDSEEKDLILSTVAIARYSDPNCSGVLISEDGIILTAEHCVDGMLGENVWVIFPQLCGENGIYQSDSYYEKRRSELKKKGYWVEGKVIATNVSYDLAAIVVDDFPKTSKPTKLATSVSRGEDVFHLGSPGNDQCFLCKSTEISRIVNYNGTYSDCSKRRQYLCLEYSNYQYGQEGTSGGPIEDCVGNVVGIHTHQDHSVKSSGGVHLNNIWSFLKSIKGLSFNSYGKLVLDKPTPLDTDKLKSTAESIAKDGLKSWHVTGDIESASQLYTTWLKDEGTVGKFKLDDFTFSCEEDKIVVTPPANTINKLKKRYLNLTIERDAELPLQKAVALSFQVFARQKELLDASIEKVTLESFSTLSDFSWGTELEIDVHDGNWKPIDEQITASILTMNAGFEHLNVFPSMVDTQVSLIAVKKYLTYLKEHEEEYARAGVEDIDLRTYYDLDSDEDEGETKYKIIIEAGGMTYDELVTVTDVTRKSLVLSPKLLVPYKLEDGDPDTFLQVVELIHKREAELAALGVTSVYRSGINDETKIEKPFLMLDAKSMKVSLKYLRSNFSVPPQKEIPKLEEIVKFLSEKKLADVRIWDPIKGDIDKAVKYYSEWFEEKRKEGSFQINGFTFSCGEYELIVTPPFPQAQKDMDRLKLVADRHADLSLEELISFSLQIYARQTEILKGGIGQIEFASYSVLHEHYEPLRMEIDVRSGNWDRVNRQITAALMIEDAGFEKISLFASIEESHSSLLTLKRVIAYVKEHEEEIFEAGIVEIDLGRNTFIKLKIHETDLFRLVLGARGRNSTSLIKLLDMNRRSLLKSSKIPVAYVDLKQDPVLFFKLVDLVRQKQATFEDLGIDEIYNSTIGDSSYRRDSTIVLGTESIPVAIKYISEFE